MQVVPCVSALRVNRSMLAFDIETTGLKPSACVVTIICTEDFFTGERKAYEFERERAEAGHNGEEADARQKKLIKELVADFEAATSLCAFNGVRFDLPFMRTALDLDDATVARWVLKTTDILEQSRLLYRTTFSLNLLCEANGIAQKTGDGLHAIQMAREGDFDGLREYCEDDVHILCNMYKKKHVLLPKLNQTQDLSEWAHPDLYNEQIADGGGVETGGATKSARDMIDDLVIEVGGAIEPSGKDLLQSGHSEIPPNFLQRVHSQLLKISLMHAQETAENVHLMEASASLLSHMA